jgi:hypothetical protein
MAVGKANYASDANCCPQMLTRNLIRLFISVLDLFGTSTRPSEYFATDFGRFGALIFENRRPKCRLWNHDFSQSRISLATRFVGLLDSSL